MSGRFAFAGGIAGLVLGVGAASFAFANLYIATTLFLSGVVLAMTVATSVASYNESELSLDEIRERYRRPPESGSEGAQS